MMTPFLHPSKQFVFYCVVILTHPVMKHEEDNYYAATNRHI
jgi:hypothetical protein